MWRKVDKALTRSILIRRRDFLWFSGHDHTCPGFLFRPRSFEAIRAHRFRFASLELITSVLATLVPLCGACDASRIPGGVRIGAGCESSKVEGGTREESIELHRGEFVSRNSMILEPEGIYKLVAAVVLEF